VMFKVRLLSTLNPHKKSHFFKPHNCSSPIDVVFYPTLKARILRRTNYGTLINVAKAK